MSSRTGSVQEVALVTGGSRGLGLEIARQLLLRGASVALVARSAGDLESARRELEANAPGRVAAWPCDVAVEEEARRAVEATVARFGRLDLLVNNAGRIDVAPLEKLSRADFEHALGVHLLGPFVLMRGALEVFARQGGGRVINVAAIEGLIGAPRIGATVASKFALVGLSESARAEWARRGVRVTLVCPGFIRAAGSAAGRPGHGGSAAPPALLRLARLPGLSIDVRRAARRILAASDRDRARLVLTPAARGLALWHALAPQSLARVAAWAERRLWRGERGPGNTTAAG